jgi:hypothetical protein
MKPIVLFALAGFSSIGLIAVDVSADVFSDAAELGANAGAMAFCSARFADEEDDGKYKLLELKLLGELGDLPDDQKAKALILKKAAEDDGDYLGKDLDSDRCTSLRKMLYLKY